MYKAHTQKELVNYWGYISILRKNGSSVFEALKKLVKGEVIPLHEIIGGRIARKDYSSPAF